MYFLSTFLSTLMLIALLVPGFVLRKVGLVSDTAAKDLSSVLIYIGTPAMIFYCMMSVEIEFVRPVVVLMCVLLSLAIHFIAYGLVRVAFHRSEDAGKKAAASFSAVFSNCGFLGIPLTRIAIEYGDSFGEASGAAISEAMLYVTIFNVVFNLLNWTLGVFLYGAAPTKKLMAKKALLNPCTVATVAALPFTLTGLSLLDPITIGDFEITQIGSMITYLYNICVPVSMCIFGIRVADSSFAHMVKSKYVYVSSAVKLVIVPLITVGVCLLLNLWLDVGLPFVLAMTVMSATPSATTALAFAERFDGDSLLASECVMATTLLSVVTIPLFLTLATAAIG